MITLGDRAEEVGPEALKDPGRMNAVVVDHRGCLAAGGSRTSGYEFKTWNELDGRNQQRQHGGCSQTEQPGCCSPGPLAAHPANQEDHTNHAPNHRGQAPGPWPRVEPKAWPQRLAPEHPAEEAQVNEENGQARLSQSTSPPRLVGQFKTQGVGPRGAYRQVSSLGIPAQGLHAQDQCEPRQRAAIRSLDPAVREMKSQRHPGGTDQEDHIVIVK